MASAVPIVNTADRRGRFRWTTRENTSSTSDLLLLPLMCGRSRVGTCHQWPSSSVPRRRAPGAKATGGSRSICRKDREQAGPATTDEHGHGEAPPGVGVATLARPLTRCVPFSPHSEGSPGVLHIRSAAPAERPATRRLAWSGTPTPAVPLRRPGPFLEPYLSRRATCEFRLTDWTWECARTKVLSQDSSNSLGIRGAWTQSGSSCGPTGAPGLPLGTSRGKRRGRRRPDCLYGAFEHRLCD